MNRFNLTFSGEILAGYDPVQVKLRFGKLLAIDDPVRLECFFSGQTIILRRNLERKDAAQCYHELHMLGAAASLVKVTTSDVVNTIANSTPAHKPNGVAAATTATTAAPGRNGSKSLASAESGSANQTWAVSSKVAARGPHRNKSRAAVQVVLKKTPGASRRESVDIAAGIKARKQESLRLEAAKRDEEQKKQEAQQRQAAEEAALQEAALEQTRRREAEEEARKQALKAEAQRKAAGEAARRKAQQAQERAERARLKAEKAARQKAEREEKKRRETEQAARRQAELEAKNRREAEEAARQQALEEQNRLAAEEVARLQAELEEIKRQEAEEAARLQAELEAIKQQEAAEAARIRAEAQRREAEAQQKSAERRRAAAQALAAARSLRKAEKRQAAAQQAALIPAQPLPAAAERTAPTVAKGGPRTKLEVPLRKPAQSAESVAPALRSRQLGEPNLYKLRPFRNTEEVRARPAQSRQRMRRSYLVGTVALAALLVAGGNFLRSASTVPIVGTNAVAMDPASGPVLLTGNALLTHDRAGVSTGEIALGALGVSTFEAPMVFDDSGALLARGQLSANTMDAASDEASRLLRCELLPVPKCRLFSVELEGSDIRAFVINPVDGSVLLADSATGQLLKADRTGKIVARAAAVLPDQPVLRLHGGLLLINSADGPAISVFRYEDSAFGNQLDEILLLPPAAQQAEQSKVGDFLWSGGAWWASMRNPDTGSVSLYRFDEEWNYLDQAALPADADAAQLVSWGEKTLVNDPQRISIQRFNAQGAIEAPFISTQLESLIGGLQRRANLSAVAWRTGLLLCAVTAALGIGFGYLQGLRSLVYKARRERGAEPVDEYTQAVQWIDPIPNRLALLRRLGINYGLLAFAILLLAIAQNVSVWQLAALLIALSGPAIAVLLLSRQPVGHIGLFQDRLLLVDHSGMYHLAGGSSVQYRKRFLMIDDVVIFCGSRWIPAFSSRQVQEIVMPLALGGVKVDRPTVLVKLLESRHPLAQAACAILAAAVAATMLLCLHGIF